MVSYLNIQYFLSFGAKNNLHTNNHHKYYLSRPTYLRKIPIELKKKLKRFKITSYLQK